MTDKFNYRPFLPSNQICFGDHCFPYYNDDNPIQAYLNHELTFVAQPLHGPKINEQHNVCVVPLMMTDEWAFAQMNHHIDMWRNMERRYDYMFIGQCGYAGREVFRTLNLDNYYFTETGPIYHLQGEEKEMELLDFLTAAAQAKFIFAPRGIGSSSFRAYQAMMVGSVPIITGMNDYPFEDQVDWDSFSLRGKLSDLQDLIVKSEQSDYNKLRENAMWFWDNYCRHDSLHEKLRAIAENELSDDTQWELGAD